MGTGGSGVRHSAALLPLPFQVSWCPVCFLTLFPAPWWGRAEPCQGSASPSSRAQLSGPHRTPGWMCLSLVWQGPLWDKGIVPTVCWVVCCAMVLLAFPATQSLR